MNQAAKHNNKGRVYRVSGTTTFLIIVLLATFLCYRWMYVYNYRRVFASNIISVTGVYERSQVALEAVVSIKYTIIGNDRDDLLRKSKSECSHIVDRLTESGVKENEIYLVERDLRDRWDCVAGSYSTIYSLCYSDYVRRGLAMNGSDWREVGHFNIVAPLTRYEASGQIIARTDKVDLAEKLSAIVYGKRLPGSPAIYDVQIQYRHGINEGDDKEMLRSAMRSAKRCADIASGDRKIRSLLNCLPIYNCNYLYGGNICDATGKVICHMRKMESEFIAI